MKRTISMILAVVMVLSISITSALAMTPDEQSKLEAEIAILEAQVEQYKKDNDIVWVEGYVTQNGDPFTMEVTNTNELASVIKGTSLSYWIDDPNVLEYDPQVGDYFNGTYQYLGKDSLFNSLGSRIIVNKLGPLPDEYVKMMDQLNEKAEYLLLNLYPNIEDTSNEFEYVEGDNFIYPDWNGFHEDGYRSISTAGNYVNGLKQGWFWVCNYDINEVYEPEFYIDNIQAWSSIDSARYNHSWENDPDYATTKIYMQIGCPFFMAYGEWKYHEYQNMGATPVATPEGRTLIPIRSFIESLYGVVEYDASTKQVTVTLNPSNVVVFTVDSNIAIVNGVSKTMDVKAQVINGKTMIPLRFACESVGITDITYLSDIQTIVIDYPLESAYKNGILNNPDAAG